MPYDIALHQLIDHVAASNKVSHLPLMQALGEVLAESQQARMSVPSGDSSSVDGYALNTWDLINWEDTVLPVFQRITAGDSATRLVPGTASRIFTGALIPDGANAVIMQEQVIAEGDSIRLRLNPKPNQNVRPSGNDVKTGDVILRRGIQLRAQDIGLAASVGLQMLPIFEKIRVGMFFTGNELVEPGVALETGQIYDSNRYTLYGLLRSLGCEIIDLGLVRDTLTATRQAMLEASEKVDLLITCGGVSVGEEDHVRIALEQLGKLHIWRLQVKPGKPFVFGEINETLFVGLPGNPVSVFVMFCLFVCPLIKTMQGRSWRKPVPMSVYADFDWQKADTRREFLRARLTIDDDGQPHATIFPNQDSGVLTSTVWATGFIEVAEDETIQQGDQVNYLAFSEFLE